jgi:hypothetical protein
MMVLVVSTPGAMEFPRVAPNTRHQGFDEPQGQLLGDCSETLFGSLKVERLHGQRLKLSVRPRMKPSLGCSAITKHACTRR